jgi:ribosome biogenesis GTPase
MGSADSPDPLAPFGWDDRARAAYAEVAGPDHVPGRVVRVDRISCVVVTATGDRIATASELPAVGDWLALEPDGTGPEDGGSMVIAATAPRWSALTRHDADRERVQVLAANVDVVLVSAPGDRPSAARVERETILGWESGAQPVVVVTKADLAPIGYVEELRERLVGVDVIVTSARDGAGIDRVARTLQPCRTAVLLGPSGAGKSTLVNALLGEERLATGAVREDDRRGRHTTSSRELVLIPSGGLLIDTPGVRTLGLGSVEDGLDAAFADVAALALRCRFRDCAHRGEPGCAVEAGVAAGTLDARRLENYRRLEDEIVGAVKEPDHAARKAEREERKRVGRQARADRSGRTTDDGN